MANIALEDFNSLVHSIYRAGSEPREWTTFVETLSSLLGGTVMSLQAHDPAAKAGLGIYISKVDPGFLRGYEQYYASRNVWAAAMGNTPIGKVIQAEELVDNDELLKTEFYNDYLRHQDFCSASTIVFHRSQGKLLLLAGTIRHQEFDRVRPSLHKMLFMLAPHIARACQMTRYLPPFTEGEDYRTMMEVSGDAFFLIDQYGRVTHANRAATSLQKEASLVSIRRGGCLQFRDPRADSALQAGLSAIKRTDFTRLQGDFVVRQAIGAPLRAMMAPIERSTSNQSIFDQAFDDLPIASLVIRTPSPRPAQLAAISRNYGLTSAEIALAQAIAGGMSPRDYADARGVSVHTVRTQLKRVFAKTETSRQSQLAILMLSTTKTG
ncbi:helix-turn-helix transcriptional regulator [Mesorhizobium sp. 1M-11]|uniref:helix-turn-helix transcriptional regulator n=1 Tax=Mesorhizobium sp. 1M-11 TaxID=1529006 RepID=UPI0006C73B73|nr:helix-turn-helix transcriptional regulator [Mesorhizobium sp. 1M-11]